MRARVPASVLYACVRQQGPHEQCSRDATVLILIKSKQQVLSGIQRAAHSKHIRSTTINSKFYRGPPVDVESDTLARLLAGIESLIPSQLRCESSEVICEAAALSRSRSASSDRADKGTAADQSIPGKNTASASSHCNSRAQYNHKSTM